MSNFNIGDRVRVGQMTGEIIETYEDVRYARIQWDNIAYGDDKLSFRMLTHEPLKSTATNEYLFGKRCKLGKLNGVMLSYNPDARRVYVTWEQNVASGWYALDELEMHNAADNPNLQAITAQMDALETAHSDMLAAIVRIRRLLEKVNDNDVT